MPEPTIRTFINHERTIQAILWPNGTMDVQLRSTSANEWNMPIRLHEDKEDDRADRD